MAYTPNKDRVVKNGIAQVSAKELDDFRKQYGEKSTLRDLLNADKGLQRRGEKTVYPQVEPKVRNQVTPDQVARVARGVGVMEPEGVSPSPLCAVLNSLIPLPNPRISSGIFLPPNINRTTTTIKITSVAPSPANNKIEFDIIINLMCDF
jgi:hypothetical protein